MSRFLVTIVIVTLSLTVYMTEGFEPFNCYKDLCTSKRHFCSHSEERCKYCMPVHCAVLEKTPRECVPWCHEWVSTTISPSTTTATKASEHIQGSSVASEHDIPGWMSKRQDGIFISNAVLAVVAVTAVLFLLLLIVLLAIILGYVIKLDRRWRPAVAGRSQRQTPVRAEEGEALLGQHSESKSTMKNSASASSMSSQLKSSTPGSGSQTIQRDASEHPLLPPYTARTNSRLNCASDIGAIPVNPAGDCQTDSLKHDRGFDYHLMSLKNQRSAGREDGARADHGDHQPHTTPIATVLSRSDGQKDPRDQSEETYPKSL